MQRRDSFSSDDYSDYDDDYHHSQRYFKYINEYISIVDYIEKNIFYPENRLIHFIDNNDNSSSNSNSSNSNSNSNSSNSSNSNDIDSLYFVGSWNKSLKNASEEDINKIKQSIMQKINEDKIMQNRVDYHKNKINYFAKKEVFNILVDLNIGIFGGAIRDSFLHDYGAKKFYKYYHEYVEDNTFLVNLHQHKLFIGKDICEVYADPDFHSISAFDRKVIINDFDTVMHESDVNRLIEYLDSETVSNFHINKNNNFSKYMNINDPLEMIESYWIISFYIEINKKFENIKIDALICKDSCSIENVLNNISSMSDFFCNSIFLYNKTFKISEFIVDKLLTTCSIETIENLENFPISNKVYPIDSLYEEEKENINFHLKKRIYNKNIVEIVKEQIYEKKCYPINELIMRKRLQKMDGKKFKFEIKLNYVESKIINDEVCLLCMDEINEEEKNIKLKCCNSNYHKKCFIELINHFKYKDKIIPCFVCTSKIDCKHLNFCFKSNLI